MTDVDLPANQTTDLKLDVGLGEAVLYVPANACVSSDVQIGVGAADVLDRGSDGVDVNYLEDSPAPAGRPKLHIDADVGVGVIEVVRDGFVRDQFREDRFFNAERDFGLDDGGTRCA